MYKVFVYTLIKWLDIASKRAVNLIHKAARAADRQRSVERSEGLCAINL